MKKLILILMSIIFLNYLNAQDPQLSNPIVDPSPTYTQIDVTNMCITLENNSSTPIPYNANNPVIITVSISRARPNQSTLSGPGLAHYNWSWSCNGCDDVDLKNDVWTLQGVQAEVIPGRASMEDIVGGALCWDNTASVTPESERTSTYGVGFNANIAATQSRDIDRSNASNNRSVYAFTESTTSVEFIKFKVSVDQEGARLDWSTSSELNNSHFEIERSMDGFNFHRIGSVSGTGTSSEVQEYRYIDQSAISVGGKLYYRLKQVDYDGTFQFSGVEFVQMDEERSLILKTISKGKIFEVVHLQSQGEVSQIEIYDMKGRNRSFLSFKSQQNVLLNLENYETGIYTIVVNNGELSERILVMK